MSSERSTGLLSGASSDSYSGMDSGAETGFLYSLRYRSPQMVLPLLVALVAVAVAAVIAVASVAAVAMHAVASVKESSSPAPPVPAPSSGPLPSCGQSLPSFIQSEHANTHLNGLQQAADIGNGTRQTGTAGYNASVAYVTSVLRWLPALTWRLQPWTELGRSGVNVIADTLTGDPTNTIVVGGHLDSYGGPGLNDDGSGSVAVLLLAAAVNDAIRHGSLVLVNRIRFHWYDAEEAGLRGSHAAVALGINATQIGERLRDWVCQMQADMVAAPNYILGIVDSTLLPPGVPNSTLLGSHVMAGMFRQQFVTLGYPFRNITRYHSQSDQWSYWAQGVPAAFGITGVFEVHTAEDVRDFGGLIGVAADAQIHTPRDNVLNVNVIAQTKMTRVYAGVLQQLAEDVNIRSTLFVTHGQMGTELAPPVHESWEDIVAGKRAAGRSGPEDDFHAWFPLAREWGVE